MNEKGPMKDHWSGTHLRVMLPGDITRDLLPVTTVLITYRGIGLSGTKIRRALLEDVPEL